MKFRTIVSVLTGGVAVIVLVTAWSVASPIGSVPDSAFHLASIWCSHSGPPTGCPIVETIPDQPRAYLPTSLIYPTCFSELPDGTPACTAGITVEGSTSTKPNQLVNLNPSGFYSALGLLAGQPLEGRVVLMRMMSGCFSALLIASSALLLHREERRRFLLVALITHLPLGLFLASSVNSSGTALAVVIAAIPVGVRLNRAVRQVEMVAVLAGAMLLFAIAMNVRKDSPPLVLAVLLAMTAERIVDAVRRSARISVIGLSFILASAAALMTVTDSVGIIRTYVYGALRPQGAGSLTLEIVLQNAIGVPLLWFASLGGWAPSDVAGLGLMDIVPPWPTALLTGSVLIVLLRDAKRSSRSIPLVSSTCLLGLSWIVPFWTLTISGLRVGEQVQPRYVLPLLASGVISATLCQSSVALRNALFAPLITASLALTHFLALGSTVLHYSYSQHSMTTFLTEEPSWHWNATPPLVVVFAGSIAFATLIHSLTSVSKRHSFSGNIPSG